MPKETRIIRWGEWRKFPVFRCWLSDSIPGILLAALSRRRSGSDFGLRFSVLYQFPETIGTIGGAAPPGARQRATTHWRLARPTLRARAAGRGGEGGGGGGGGHQTGVFIGNSP